MERAEMQAIYRDETRWEYVANELFGETGIDLGGTRMGDILSFKNAPGCRMSYAEEDVEGYDTAWLAEYIHGVTGYKAMPAVKYVPDKTGAKRCQATMRLYYGKGLGRTVVSFTRLYQFNDGNCDTFDCMVPLVKAVAKGDPEVVAKVRAYLDEKMPAKSSYDVLKREYTPGHSAKAFKSKYGYPGVVDVSKQCTVGLGANQRKLKITFDRFVDADGILRDSLYPNFLHCTVGSESPDKPPTDEEVRRYLEANWATLTGEHAAKQIEMKSGIDAGTEKRATGRGDVYYRVNEKRREIVVYLSKLDIEATDKLENQRGRGRGPKCTRRKVASYRYGGRSGRDKEAMLQAAIDDVDEWLNRKGKIPTFANRKESKKTPGMECAKPRPKRCSADVAGDSDSDSGSGSEDDSVMVRMVL